MSAEAQRTVLDRIFIIGLVLKMLDGVLELFGGVLLLFVSPGQIDALVRALTQHELAEDPNDLIANALVNAAAALDVSAALFAAVYLLAHGVVKVLLVGAVLLDRLWAYPWLIGFLVLFIGYQAYRLVVAFDAWMLALTIFDIVIVGLTVREYRLHRARRARRVEAGAPGARGHE